MITATDTISSSGRSPVRWSRVAASMVGMPASATSTPASRSGRTAAPTAASSGR